jgi:hypothetical protein
LFRSKHGGERGKWEAFDADGTKLGEGVLDATTVDYADSNVGTVTVNLGEGPDGPATFRHLVFSALDYTRPTGTDAGDFYIRSVEYDAVPEPPDNNDSFRFTFADETGTGGSGVGDLDAGDDPGYQVSEAETIVQITVDADGLA